MLYLILFHMCLAYFFGGIAKLNIDWLSGTPMDIFLAERKNHPLGFIYTHKLAPYIFSYGGVLFDLGIVPLMLIRRTRILGLILSVMFHVSNVWMFGLATFPWFSLFLTTMFFDPSWPRRIPLFKSFMPWGIERDMPEFKVNKPLVIALSAYAVIHLALPFRHFLYPGVTSWTEEGHMFSWRMMLRHKQGNVVYFVQKKNTGIMTLVDPLQHITPRQFDDIIGKPDLILSFGHYLRDYYQKLWNSEVSIYASSRVSLNGRPRKEMIIPGIDLAKEERSILPYRWIRPLENKDSYLVQQE